MIITGFTDTSAFNYPPLKRYVRWFNGHMYHWHEVNRVGEYARKGSCHRSDLPEKVREGIEGGRVEVEWPYDEANGEQKIQHLEVEERRPAPMVGADGWLVDPTEVSSLEVVAAIRSNGTGVRVLTVVMKSGAMYSAVMSKERAEEIVMEVRSAKVEVTFKRG